MRIGAALRRLLPFLALATVATTVGATWAVAGDTLGYDFRAYHGAAVRVLDGGSAYDQAYELAGAFGLFFYPPTFVPLVLPFGLLPEPVAIQAWLGVLVLTAALAFLAMPVSWSTRWAVVLLAGLSWPFVYNLKLGQVGPILLLLFALAWRFLDRPPVVGLAGALGAAVKVQPGLLLAWALLRRQWAALVAAAFALVVLGVLSLLVAGAQAWPDFVGLLTRVSDPIATPQNMTPGAVAWRAGMARDAAGGLQLAVTAGVGLVFLWAAVRLPHDASFLVAVITTQLVSPILWDHYAVILLVPVAWLLERGRWWAAVIPLLTPVFLVGTLPEVVYPLAFGVSLLAVIREGLAEARFRAMPLLIPLRAR